MNPSHGLSWEKSGEQEGVFATLFILNGKLDIKIQIITLSEKTGTNSNTGIIIIPKSSYPDAKCIIPFGYDSTLGYRIGIFDVSTKSFRFAVQTAISGAWAESKTITFSALIIK